MKFRILIFTILLWSNNVSGQLNSSEIIGNWVKYKAERKDGSRIIDRQNTEDAKFEFYFSGTEYCHRSHAQQNRCISYKIEENYITMNGIKSYLIEKLNKDTLIIVENDEYKSDDKLNRLYFSKKEYDAKKLEYDEGVAIMSEDFTPYFKGTLVLHLVEKMKNKFTPIKFRGYIIIDRINSSVSTTILEHSEPNNEKVKKTAQKITKILNSSFGYWQFDKGFPINKVKIYFLGDMELGKGYWFTFFVEDVTISKLIEDIKNRKSIEVPKINSSLANDYFDKGLENLNSGNYDAAIEDFTKCYENDFMNIDALYNRAAIYQAQGKIDLACKDLKQLTDLGQKEAEKIYNKLCK